MRGEGREEEGERGENKYVRWEWGGRVGPQKAEIIPYCISVLC